MDKRKTNIGIGNSNQLVLCFSSFFVSLSLSHARIYRLVFNIYCMSANEKEGLDNREIMETGQVNNFRGNQLLCFYPTVYATIRAERSKILPPLIVIFVEFDEFAYRV